MKTLNIAITGFGNVGQHIARLLWQRQAAYRERYATDVRLVGVCRSRSGLLGTQGLNESDVLGAEFVPDLSGEAFLQGLQADVLIDAGPSDFETGGMGLVYMRHALNTGMHVIAVSKGALALHGPELLQTADYVVLITPLTPEPYHIIGREQLRMMKPSAILVNIARGGVVDHDALLQALQEKWIHAAAIDVTEPEPLPRNHPLLQLDNLVITPHLGSAALQTRQKMAERTVNNLLAGMRGEALLSQVV